ncbi:MAG: hypothetical protein KGJ79_04850 [Alphaproteobacteria bacterium]|nr:hypothetical protein [Alphaproteobacteria bacterium]MDE2110451.1 hypothetical protein [Alphaproteobacteria bacterium]MDE2493390.1 hypothetical protein [Alphaproteobacteria bacterium]
MHEPNYEGHPPHRFGCLKGCLTAVLLGILVAGGLIGFLSWKIYRGFEGDHHLQTILNIANNDGRVRAELGGTFYVMEIERQTFPYGKGRAIAYQLMLVGPNGKGELDVRLEPKDGRTVIVSMILTGPDRRPIAIIGKGPQSLLQTIWIPPDTHPA